MAKQTKTQLFWEIFRFLMVGGGATVVDYAVSNLFYGWLVPPTAVGTTLALIFSTVFGFCVGLVINWLLSVVFVFRQVEDKQKSSSGKAFLTFTLIGVVGLIVSVLGMQLVHVLPPVTLFGTATFLNAEWTWWIMKVVMTVIVLVWNYLARKTLIFK